MTISQTIWKTRNKTLLDSLVSDAGCFCLFSGCARASGWHRRRPEGNIRLIYWSLFSPSSIAAVWWPGFRGTICQRRGWRQSCAWCQPPLASSYLPPRSMTHFMYLIVKHWDLSWVTGQWGIPQENPADSAPLPCSLGWTSGSTWPSSTFWEQGVSEPWMRTAIFLPNMGSR